MPEEREDPIEAIKRRNEERARRLKERIAQGDFDRFVTPLEAVDEALPAGPEQLEAPAADFDLSFFPAPPEPAAVSFDEPSAAPAAPEAAPTLAPPDFPPPTEAVPEAAPAAFPDFPPPPDMPPMEGLVSDAELAAPEPAAWPPLNIGTEEVAALASAPPPPAEVPGEDSFAGLELTDLDLEVMGDFEAPQPWDGRVAEMPPGAGGAFPPEEIAPIAAIEPPPLEIVVEAPAAAPEAATAQLEPPMAAAPPVVERVTPPPVAPAAPPVFERETPPPRREEPLVAAPPEALEPALGEEEVEAIKATIEAEIREMPPAAPPISAITPPTAPVIPPVEAKPAPAPEAPVAAAPPVAAPAKPVEEAEIFIGVEVRGNKVRIERRNITLAAAIELFQAIIDRYQNR